MENYVTGALLFLPSRLTANQTVQKSSSSKADLTTLMEYDPSTWNYGRPQRLAALRSICTIRHISEMLYGMINRINPIFVVRQIHVVRQICAARHKFTYQVSDCVKYPIINWSNVPVSNYKSGNSSLAITVRSVLCQRLEEMVARLFDDSAPPTS
jgi:hypothetical protein